ncbi:hypothetical protein J3F83DRAFT_583103 [Trichoderma novae-zelandiae]
MACWAARRHAMWHPRAQSRAAILHSLMSSRAFSCTRIRCIFASRLLLTWMLFMLQVYERKNEDGDTVPHYSLSKPIKLCSYQSGYAHQWEWTQLLSRHNTHPPSPAKAEKSTWGFLVRRIGGSGPPDRRGRKGRAERTGPLAWPEQGGEGGGTLSTKFPTDVGVRDGCGFFGLFVRDTRCRSFACVRIGLHECRGVAVVDEGNCEGMRLDARQLR